MADIFISYRRTDAAGHARALHRDLCLRFPPDRIFFDRKSVESGEKFHERILTVVTECQVLLSLIGPDWLNAQGPDGKRRLDDPEDVVRGEIALALHLNKPVIPVLFDDAPMPKPDELPEPLKPLAGHDALNLRGKNYEYDIQLNELVRLLARVPGVPKPVERAMKVADGLDLSGIRVVVNQNRLVQIENFIQGLPTGPAAVDGQALRRNYLNRVLALAKRLPLEGIDPLACHECHGRMNLDAVYTALKTRARPAADVTERHAGEAPKPTSALVQIDRHRQLALLGDPGSGKTTLLNFVTMCMAGELLGEPGTNLALLTRPLPSEEDQEQPATPQPWSHGALLPVPVALREFAARGLPPAGERAGTRHLFQFITDDLRRANLGDYAPFLFKELLETGGLLLLDGLDEVPQAAERRDQIKQVIGDLSATLRHCRILVTSRTYPYLNQNWRVAELTEIALAPFDRPQIAAFVARWYAHVAELRGISRADADGRAADLKRAIFGNERLQELAERPLLLTLMTSLHAWRGGTLPQKRAELYADAVDLLLDWWEGHKIIYDEKGAKIVQPSLSVWLKTDRQKMRMMLNELAFEAHARQPELRGSADIPETDLVVRLYRLCKKSEIREKDVAAYLSDRAGLLVHRGEEVYTFPHRSFQEYLAACHLNRDANYSDTGGQRGQ